MKKIIKHNFEFDATDHFLRIKKYANMFFDEDNDEYDLEHVKELIETADEMGLLLACYYKHRTGKANPDRFKQYCPLCYECIHCDCALETPKLKPDPDKITPSDVPF